MYYFLKVLYKSLIYYCYVVLAAFMYNNCKALRAGKYSYDHLGHPALLGPVERGSVSSMDKAAVISGGSSSSVGGVWGDMPKPYSKADTVAEFSVVGTHGQHSEGAILNLAIGLSG